jgi:ornithine cyclodeaminase/alanine dehydrogenase-like protein (mu-crystallin family)
VQARYQLRMLAAVTPCRLVYLWSRRPAQAEALAAELRGEGWAATPVPSPREACRESNIILTVTPSRAPLVDLSWVRGREVLILAIGADSVGKQELGVGVVEAADLLVVDSRVQCAERGEAQHAVARGTIILDGGMAGGARGGGLVGVDSMEQCAERGEAQHAVRRGTVFMHAGVRDGAAGGEAGGGSGGALRPPRVVEIGECVGLKDGSTIGPAAGYGGDSSPRLVVFDSTGVAVQDVAIAELALQVLQAKTRPTARL